jgi:hypothetical protein
LAIKHLALLFAASAVVIGLFLSVLPLTPDSVLSHLGRMPTWKKRIQTHFIKKEHNPDDDYQQRQASTAIALRRISTKRTGQLDAEALFAGGIFRFHFCDHHRGVRFDRRDIYRFHIPAATIPMYQA